MADIADSSDHGRLSAVPASSPAPPPALHPHVPMSSAASTPTSTTASTPNPGSLGATSHAPLPSGAPPAETSNPTTQDPSAGGLMGSGFSAATEEILRRINVASASMGQGTPGWEAAKKRVLQSMVTSEQFTPTGASPTPDITWSGRGRGRGTATSVRVGSARMANAHLPAMGGTGPSGRGRGRGRPAGARGRGRGGRRGSKRKREDSDEDETSELSPSETESSDFSANWTPAQTRSGRNINKPSQFTPMRSEGSTDSPHKRVRRSLDGLEQTPEGVVLPPAPTQSQGLSSDAPSLNGSNPRLKLILGPRSAGNGNGPGPGHSQGRGSTRNNEPMPESSVCTLCQRGVSPKSNPIVYCDGCNAPYHKFCHHPPVAEDVIASADADWFCATCHAGVSKRGRKGKGRQKTKAPIVGPLEVETNGTVPSDVRSLVGGKSPEEKRQYFSSLPHATLVEFLVQLTSPDPAAPVQLTNLNSLPVNGISSATNGTPLPVDSAPDLSDFLESATDSIFPKSGHGLYHTVLGRETDDLDFLLDDNDDVYSHLVLNRHTGQYESVPGLTMGRSFLGH